MLKKIYNKLSIIIRDKYIEYKIKKISSEKDRFSLIYNSRYWKGFNEGSISGAGSDFNSTYNIKIYLDQFIREYKVNSILDIPCGDFYWLSNFDFTNITYIGADIVDEIIIDNKKNHLNKNLKFINLDIVNDKLPDVDLIFIRDCFVHLTNEQIIQALRNIKNSKSKLVALTTFTTIEENKYNNNVDRWRPLNMCKAPFNLPKPIRILNDSPLNSNIDQDKNIGIWEIKNL